ncbi:MAG: histidine phosphatase family protein [Planctomycetaceae bacterium]
MADIVLIRPGSTDFDTQHRIQGSLDVPLNPRGLEQVQKIIEQIQDTNIDVLHVAPNEPAQTTARMIADACDIKVKVDDIWKNVHLGLWQGLPAEQVQHKSPKLFKHWCTDPQNVAPPSGEDLAPVIERLRKSLHKILRKKQCAAVVASEPLATLIEEILQSRQSNLRSAILNGGHAPSVTILHCDQSLPTPATESQPSEMMDAD